MPYKHSRTEEKNTAEVVLDLRQFLIYLINISHYSFNLVATCRCYAFLRIKKKILTPLSMLFLFFKLTNYSLVLTKQLKLNLIKNDEVF